MTRLESPHCTQALFTSRALDPGDKHLRACVAHLASSSFGDTKKSSQWGSDSWPQFLSSYFKWILPGENINSQKLPRWTKADMFFFEGFNLWHQQPKQHLAFRQNKDKTIQPPTPILGSLKLSKRRKGGKCQHTWTRDQSQQARTTLEASGPSRQTAFTISYRRAQSPAQDLGGPVKPYWCLLPVHRRSPWCCLKYGSKIVISKDKYFNRWILPIWI